MDNLELSISIINSQHASVDNVKIANALILKELKQDDTILDDIVDIVEDLTPITKTVLGLII